MSVFDNKSMSQITDRVIIYIIVMIVFTLIVDLLKIDNHFSNLNADSSIMDSLYLVSMTFTGSGYGGIYAQTALSRFVMVLLSFVKFLLIAEAFGTAILKKDDDTYESFIIKLFGKNCIGPINGLRDAENRAGYPEGQFTKLKKCFNK